MSKVILVCGGRGYDDADRMRSVLAQYKTHKPTIRHGGARGADALADGAARILGYGVEVFPANWARHGKAAGPLRNQAMLDADPQPWLCIVFPGGRGTNDMHQRALRHGLVCLLPHGSVLAPS